MIKRFAAKKDLQLGDLVYYNDIYVIPPDAINWKFREIDTQDKLAIILEVRKGEWDLQPYGNNEMYRIMHVKSGYIRTCTSINLTKAYINDDIEIE